MHTISTRALQSNRTSATSGFTLLEVLIAIVIFSIGLLGVAGLQVAGLRFTQGSQLRAIATMQAENLVDRMRANAAGNNVAPGTPSAPAASPDGVRSFYNVTSSMPTSYSVDCDTTSCTPQQLATFDLVSWNQAQAQNSTKPAESNADVLPGGQGIVCIDATPDDGDSSNWACDNDGIVYAIKIEWQERTSGEDDTANNQGNADVGSKMLVMRVIP